MNNRTSPTQLPLPKRTRSPYKNINNNPWLKNLREWVRTEDKQKDIRIWFAKTLWGKDDTVYPSWDKLSERVQQQWLKKADACLKTMSLKGIVILLPRWVNGKITYFIVPLVKRQDKP